MAQAAALCDRASVVTLPMLPEPVRPARPAAARAGGYRARVDAHRRDLIADALDRAGGNRSRAARDLGLSRQALLYLIRELKVEAKRSRAFSVERGSARASAQRLTLNRQPILPP